MAATFAVSKWRLADFAWRNRAHHCCPRLSNTYNACMCWSLRINYGRRQHATKQRSQLESWLLKVAATYSPTTCSTIGVAELNDPVRNGKGWDLSAITTLIIL